MCDTGIDCDHQALDIETTFHDVSVEEYADLSAPYQSFSPLNIPSASNKAQIRAWRVGAIFFSEYVLPPSASKLAKNHLNSFGHTISIDRVLSGESHGVSDGGEEYCNDSRAIEFGDQDLWEGVNSAMRGQSVSLPKAMLGYEAGDLVPDISIPLDTGIGEIVSAEWDTVFAALWGRRAPLMKSDVDRFLACLKIALGVSPQREDIRAQAREALHRKICRYIERNLSQPDLSTGSILRNFGVSRAGLYRMFEPQGGVRTYMTERRSVRALLDIWNADGQRGAVQAAADKWGFSTGPNFNRVINRMFGGNPGGLFSPRSGVGAPMYAATDNLFVRTHMASRG